MADPQTTMRGVSMVLDTPQLQAQLQRMLTDSQTPLQGSDKHMFGRSPEASCMSCMCMSHIMHTTVPNMPAAITATSRPDCTAQATRGTACTHAVCERPLFERRRFVVGDQLDTLVGTSKEVSEPTAGLVAGLILLLHLCDPAQYTADIAAAACAALAAVVADGSSMHPHLSPTEVHYVADRMTGAHSHQLAAAMQHDGVIAQVAQLRPDAIATLAAGAFRVSDASGDTPQQIVRDNAELFEILQASAVQVSLNP